MKKELSMGYAKQKTKTRWVSVPVEDRLHEEARSRAARCRMAWPDIIAEAISMWLAAKAKESP